MFLTQKQQTLESIFQTPNLLSSEDHEISAKAKKGLPSLFTDEPERKWKQDNLKGWIIVLDQKIILGL